LPGFGTRKLWLGVFSLELEKKFKRLPHQVKNMELESSDLSDIPPPPQSDEFDSDDCDAGEIVRNISCGDSNVEDKNSSISNDDSVETVESISTRCESHDEIDSDPQVINYFENDGDYDYDGSVSDALSDHSIDEEDSLNSPQHRDPPARSSSANTRMHHLHALQTFVVILEAFCLRCAFDHWKRERNDSNNLSILSPRVLDAFLHSHVEKDGSDNDIMDHSHDFMDQSSISSSSEILLNDLFLKESLESNIDHRINLAQAFDVMKRVLSTASIRGALFVWAETSKRICRKERLRLQCKMVEAQEPWRKYCALGETSHY
jgi:hypothetical protein